MIQRLEGVLNSVEAATESVQKVLQVGFTPAVRADRDAAPKNRDDSLGADEKTKYLTPPREMEHKSSNQRGSPAKQERAESKQHRLEEEVASDEAVEGGGEEDDLQSTIDTWLNKQKRSVTRRKKWQQQPTPDRYSLMNVRTNSVSNNNMDPSAGEGGGEPMTYTSIEEDLNMMAAAAGGEGAATQLAHEVDDEDDFDMDPMDNNDNEIEADIDDNSSEVSGAGVGVTLSRGRDRGVYLGNDVEVVGLQCMLAKALMGDDDDDEEDGSGVDLGDMSDHKDYKDG